MRRALLKLLLFTIVLWTIDSLFGTFFNYLQARAIGGSIGKINKIANTLTADILIFGSSKGGSNYNPIFFSDSLYTCYNCSRNSNGIILMYGRYRMLLERYIPKIIIYDIKPEFDLYENDNTRYTVFLKPFYERKGIDSLIWLTDYSEKFKMHSFLYRFNYRFLEVLLSQNGRLEDDDNGYNNQATKIIPKGVDMPAEEQNSKIDSLKMKLMERLIHDCKRTGTKLIFVFSPEYFPRRYDLKAFQSLCKNNHISFIDYSNYPLFVSKRCYFQDRIHMNSKGADMFSKALSDSINSIMNVQISNK